MTPEEAKIALVEDDADLRASLMECMELSGFRAFSADSARQFYRLMVEHDFDVVLVDIGLPDEDGLSVVRFLREHKPKVGIVMLTARGTISDRISGLDVGADIYMVKPVEFSELEAVIRSLLRRLNGTVREAPASDVPNWTFRRDSLSLIAPDGKAVGMSSQESRLLIALMESKGDVVPRSSLLSDLGYADDDGGHRSLSAVLVRLRSKVEQATGLSLPIQTVRGQGYLVHGLREG